MYSQIKQLQEEGFSEANVAKRLGINRRTVRRYWDMSADEYENQCISRIKLLGEHQEIITHWLREYQTVSAAQVCDWPKEHYGSKYPERTVSAENIIAKVKVFKITSNKYRNRRKRFGLRMSLICGIINYGK